MNTTKIVTLIFLGIVFSVIAINCKHEIPIIAPSTGGTGAGSGGNGSGGTGGGGGKGTTAADTCSADTVYFSNTVLPMIVSNCATTGCHDSATHREGLILTNYNKIKGEVSPGNPSGSRLFTVISSGKMPPAGKLSATQIAALSQWITQGALNNTCRGGCDTATFTYSGAVSSIMSTYCVGCHNANSLGGGIDLSTYAGVVSAATGKLMGAVNQLSGYYAMPLGGTKLSDCQITQIQKWINAGKTNN